MAGGARAHAPPGSAAAGYLRDLPEVCRRVEVPSTNRYPGTYRTGSLDAAATMRDVLDEVEALARQWSEEIAWLRSQNSRMPMEDVHQGHTAVRAAIRLVRTALDVFSRAALHPERASLDAPYGHGAPSRVHPGAQCTWVAERAEELAVELASVTLRKENLLLTQPH